MLGEIPFCLTTGKAKPRAQIETYQTNIRMPDKRGKKTQRKNINTDGKEIADLQETMRSDSSAVSPHLIWQQDLRGPLFSQVSKSGGRCGSASCVQKVPVPSLHLRTWFLKNT